MQFLYNMENLLLNNSNNNNNNNNKLHLPDQHILLIIIQQLCPLFLVVYSRNHNLNLKHKCRLVVEFMVDIHMVTLQQQLQLNNNNNSSNNNNNRQLRQQSRMLRFNKIVTMKMELVIFWLKLNVPYVMLKLKIKPKVEICTEND